MAIWKGKETIHKKPWGEERRFNSPFPMSGKVITLNADHRTSLKYYLNKDEMLYCLEGRVSVYAPNEKEFGDLIDENGSYFELFPGDILLIERENPYRIKALVDSKLIEVVSGGTQGSIHQGLVMLEDDYGRKFIKKDNN